MNCIKECLFRPTPIVIIGVVGFTVENHGGMRSLSYDDCLELAVLVIFSSTQDGWLDAKGTEAFLGESCSYLALAEDALDGSS
jgi:hypothetical protein